jgi:hypothetical protein
MRFPAARARLIACVQITAGLMSDKDPDRVVARLKLRTTLAWLDLTVCCSIAA